MQDQGKSFFALLSIHSFPRFLQHVIRAKTRPERRRRCLCLAAILMVLLALLSAGVVTIANFLVFSDDESTGLAADKAFSQLRHPNRSRCAERVGIAEKIRSSDVVVIGREDENGRIQIVRTLRSPELQLPELSDKELKVSEWPPECVTHASKVRQVFFLGRNDRGDLFHRFRAEKAQPKLTQVIRKIVDDAEITANSSEGKTRMENVPYDSSALPVKLKSGSPRER